jgi:hypothetical protein
MIGFVIGVLCLVGLVKVARGGRGFGRCHGGMRGFGGAEGRGYGRGRWFLRGLFERLDTSPGQEKAISAALEDLYAKKREIADEFLKTRGDVAKAVRGPVFDEAALDEAFSRQDVLLVSLRASVTQAAKTIHEALDDRQRAAVGNLLEGALFGGGHGPFGHGPYRGSVWA